MTNIQLSPSQLFSKVVLVMLWCLCSTAFADQSKLPVKKTVADNSVLLSDDRGIVGLRIYVFTQHFPRIFGVLPDTPAAKVGLKEGDEVLAVNGRSTRKVTQEELYQMLEGKPDTRLKLKVRRSNSTFEMMLTRAHLTALAKTNPDIWMHYQMQSCNRAQRVN